MKERRMIPKAGVRPAISDPYRNFRIRIWWDGRYVAGLSKAGGLARPPETAKNRGISDRSAGRTVYDAITLDRGLTCDPEFVQWAQKRWNFGPAPGSGVSFEDFRKDLTIEIYAEAGKPVDTYRVYRCWVSEYQALPDLDANAHAIAIQHIRLENEGWERDTEVSEPAEPST